MAQNGGPEERGRQGPAHQSRLPDGQAAQHETLRVTMASPRNYLQPDRLRRLERGHCERGRF